MSHVSKTNTLDDIKWWLHLQPGFASEKDFTHEQLAALETEIEVASAEFTNETTQFCGDADFMENHSTQSDIKRNVFSCAYHTLVNDRHTRTSELKVVYNNNAEILPKSDMGKLSYPENHLIGLNSLNNFGSKSSEGLSSVYKSDLIGTEKAEPWWQKADKDDLASFVAKKSLEHVENCDLPQPHGKNFRRGPFYSLENFNIYGLLGSYLYKNDNPTSVNMEERQDHFDDPRLSLNASDGPFRNHDYGTSTSTKNKDLAESGLVSENSYSKAQLLAALRHSQTRARRAEEEAQKLQTERERITKLFFKQASHLFAYKHWLHLLHLENLFFQLKSTDHRPVSVLFPKQGKRVSQKQRLPRHSMSSTSAVSFALGLSLAGIGLLLGCTWVVLA